MSHNTNCKFLRNRYKCSNCSAGYMSEHHRNVHEKLCEEKQKSMDKYNG